jgi:hypothetical protein
MSTRKVWYSLPVARVMIDEFRARLPPEVIRLLETSIRNQTAAKIVKKEIEFILERQPSNNLTDDQETATIKLYKIIIQSKGYDTGPLPPPSLPPGTVIKRLTVAQMDSITNTIVDAIMEVL